MILIAGGTGRLGRLLVERIDEPVRVLSRSPTADSAAQVSIGDLRDVSSLTRAVQGCRAVVSAAHGFVGGRGAGPEAVDRDGNAHLIGAASAAGVEHFLLLSVHDARPDHPMSLHRMKYAAEQVLAGSGMRSTILRPSAYYETWTQILGAKVGSGGPAMVFGRGNNPISFVSVRNVADAVTSSLADPAARGETIDVVGPENLTMTQVAEALARSAGAPGRVKHVPFPVLRAASVLARPVAPAFARMAAGAVAMDTVPMAADSAATAQRFPEIGWRTLADVLND